VSVPLVVTGEPDTVKIDGIDRPTLVTVPPAGVVHAGTPPDTVSTCPVVPIPSRVGVPLQYSISPVVVIERGMRFRLAAVRTCVTTVPAGCDTALVPACPLSTVNVVPDTPVTVIISPLTLMRNVGEALNLAALTTTSVV